ncbi:hypothetical protein [Actinophytocola oryzae]|uniref:DUF4367 domain-containing protein n=1 Tax=Actinophytocola oryzae TaxID=502181 RepID=A0A4V3FRI1_9PSEU|nr:hypothetical protein [Actinophytocola oryzae]TDV43621.1 hypothetical protein CLV71_11583 [Actinophytocola oryzae]
MNDDQLETALRALGARLDVPDPPDLTDAVLARLDDEPRWQPATVHRIAAAVLAAVVALATAMTLSPTVRAAVYDFFRIGGVEFYVNEPAPTSPPPWADPLLPGEHDVSLAQARRDAEFPLRLPATLGPPTLVRVVDDARVVSMAFGAHGEVRVDQFDGGLATMFGKFTRAEDIVHVTVSGDPAVWVNRPHPVLYTGRDGVMRQASARVAGSTLIWEHDGITYRVEGDLTAPQAIEVAESLRP